MVVSCLVHIEPNNRKLEVRFKGCRILFLVGRTFKGGEGGSLLENPVIDYREKERKGRWRKKRIFLEPVIIMSM
jgi:hypothetical protein